MRDPASLPLPSECIPNVAQDVVNWIGIFGFYIGCTLYAYFSYQAKNAKKPDPKAEAPAAAPAAAAEDEEAPLLKKS